MHLKDILGAKGRDVHTVEPESTLAEVVEQLVECNCGSLVVCERGEMVGIITERDILRACARENDSLESIKVKERMTADVITASPEDEVGAAMGVLTTNRIRHLPVLEDGKLAGMISIGDVVKAQHDKLTMENHYLMNYIQS